MAAGELVAGELVEDEMVEDELGEGELVVVGAEGEWEPGIDGS